MAREMSYGKQSIKFDANAEEAEKDGSAPVVAVEDLHKSFGSQKVLNGISLSVSRGETLAVLGRSGTGKSVLLRIIIGLQKPDSGSVRIHGQEIDGPGSRSAQRDPEEDGLFVSACCAVRLADRGAERGVSAAAPQEGDVES